MNQMRSGFLPSTGPLLHFRMPTGAVRVDGGVEEGGEITPFYDPMIAKLIAHAPTREAAAGTLAGACAAVEVWPVKTNAGFLTRCLDHPDFVSGAVDTAFIETRLDQLVPNGEPSAEVLAAAAEAKVRAAGEGPASPWSALTGFRLNAPAARRVTLTVDGRAAPVELTGAAPILPSVQIGSHLVVFDAGQAFAFGAADEGAGDTSGGGDGAVRSPMPGRIVAVQASTGQAVDRGQPLVVLEAMKMEHILTAPFDAVVAEIKAEAGGQVSEGAVLVRLDKRG